MKKNHKETRVYSYDKSKARIENSNYQNIIKDNGDPYYLMNNGYSSNMNDIKKNLNKFKETNEYIQQKYDFSEKNKKNEEENLERLKIEHNLLVFYSVN